MCKIIKLRGFSVPFAKVMGDMYTSFQENTIQSYSTTIILCVQHLLIAIDYINISHWLLTNTNLELKIW
jgi:hypothetical protein